MDNIYLSLIVVEVPILLGGILGGIARSVVARHDGEKVYPTKDYILVGTVASHLTPLFLAITQSDIISRIESSITPSDLLVLLGYCIVASYISPRFLKGLSQKIMNQLATQSEETEKLKNALVSQNATLEEKNNIGKELTGIEATIFREISNYNRRFYPERLLYNIPDISAKEINDGIKHLKQKSIVSSFTLNSNSAIYLYIDTSSDGR